MQHTMRLFVSMRVRSDSGKCLPSWVERNANVFQILIGEMGEYGNILVLGKAQSVSAELLKSVRNLPHRGPGGASFAKP